MPQASTPLISIVIPTYEMKGQGVFFLKRCLDSIEKQINIDPQAIEIVISDQSSNQAIAQFCQHHSFLVHYYRTDTGRGIAAHNLNQGIAKARGAYIKILFQDDLLVQDTYLATLLQMIQEQGAQCILSTATHTRDGKEFYDQMTPKENSYFLFGNNTVSSPSVLTVAKSVFEALSFDEHLKLLFDCDFYYRLFHTCQNIMIAPNISVANGIWEGQSQFSISAKQFTQEVRYLNWKYPSAQLPQAIVPYQQYFANLHPNAPFPFDTKIEPTGIEKIWWALTRKKSVV
jgi:glycosyltransferase involved in cell wall biosynthesis